MATETKELSTLFATIATNLPTSHHNLSEMFFSKAGILTWKPLIGIRLFVTKKNFYHLMYLSYFHSNCFRNLFLLQNRQLSLF